MRRLRTLAVGLALLALPGHVGPPFPIVTDHSVGDYVVSVWTDPDIGIGTFYVVLESASGREIGDGLRVRVGVEPTSKRLDEVLYDAERERTRRGARFVTRVDFDRGEWWHVRVLIDGPGGEGEIRSEVEATPDGQIGPIGLVVYAMPFVLVALLWIKAVRARRAMAGEAEE